MSTKTCSKCGVKLPATGKYFYLDKRNKSGLGARCKECDCARKSPESAKKYYKKQLKENPNFIRKTTLREHNLTLKDYDKMSEAQEGLCAICGLPEIIKLKGKIKKLSIDHNHNTGKIRGLLCQKCNVAIGMLKVDNLGILNLEKTIEYLNSFK